MADEITNADIATAALTPKSGSIDGNAFTSRDVSELLAAQEAIAKNNAGANPFLGLRVAQVNSVRPQ